MCAECGHQDLEGDIDESGIPYVPSDSAAFDDLEEYLDRKREKWVIIDGVGGYVCAVPMEGRPGGICGMPTESEPCSEHGARSADDAEGGGVRVSIWASIDGPDVLALDGHNEAANYRAEGEPSVYVDVATTSFHDHVRLALWSVNSKGEPTFGLEVCTLLSSDAVRALRDKLNVALGETA